MMTGTTINNRCWGWVSLSYRSWWHLGGSRWKTLETKSEKNIYESPICPIYIPYLHFFTILTFPYISKLKSLNLVAVETLKAIKVLFMSPVSFFVWNLSNLFEIYNSLYLKFKIYNSLYLKFEIYNPIYLKFKIYKPNLFEICHW